jgi:hypothetical protein
MLLNCFCSCYSIITILNQPCRVICHFGFGGGATATMLRPSAGQVWGCAMLEGRKASLSLLRVALRPACYVLHCDLCAMCCTATCALCAALRPVRYVLHCDLRAMCCTATCALCAALRPVRYVLHCDLRAMCCTVTCALCVALQPARYVLHCDLRAMCCTATCALCAALRALCHEVV